MDFVPGSDWSNALVYSSMPEETTPTSLPEGWLCARDEVTGCEYYYNERLQYTQWEKPSGPATAAPDSEAPSTPFVGNAESRTAPDMVNSPQIPMCTFPVRDNGWVFCNGGPGCCGTLDAVAATCFFPGVLHNVEHHIEHDGKVCRPSLVSLLLLTVYVGHLLRSGRLQQKRRLKCLQTVSHSNFLRQTVLRFKFP